MIRLSFYAQEAMEHELQRLELMRQAVQMTIDALRPIMPMLLASTDAERAAGEGK